MVITEFNFFRFILKGIHGVTRPCTKKRDESDESLRFYISKHHSSDTNESAINKRQCLIKHDSSIIGKVHVSDDLN